jgi:hypothetical protein
MSEVVCLLYALSHAENKKKIVNHDNNKNSIKKHFSTNACATLMYVCCRLVRKMRQSSMNFISSSSRKSEHVCVVRQRHYVLWRYLLEI